MSPGCRGPRPQRQTPRRGEAPRRALALGLLPWRGLALSLLLCAAGLAPAHADPGTLEFYKPNTLLSSWDFTKPADRQDHEAELQFSFKKRFLDWGILHAYFGYSQRSFWQVYDAARSRPFRETDYNPELFFENQPDWRPLGAQLTLRWSLLEHESNGRGVELEENGESTLAGTGSTVTVSGATPVNQSRSWNRAYLRTLLLWQAGWDTQLSFKYWQRYPEPSKANPLDASGDDNPDIQDYLGYGELRAEFAPHSLPGASPSQRARLLLRQGSIASTGTVQVDYSYQLHDLWSTITPGWYLHAQYFYGYGESLIDYNRLEKKLALGLSVR